ncbi:alpha/beta fold hydrolase [Pseudidiomarina sp.]|uniref:S9 family peptidase n=1 Tax=Pseudidiomarina sp. TaxID=2081707 RepID=UPI003A9719BC
MRIAVVLITCAALLGTCFLPSAAAQSAATIEAVEGLSIERIFSAPNLTTSAPQQIKFSPSGTHVSYLAGSTEHPNVLDLWLYDVRENQHQRIVKAADLTNPNQQLSAEEQARRERLRVRSSGIVDYYWAPDSTAILFPVNGQLYLFDRAAKQASKLTDDNLFATDIRFSPQGTYISFVHDYNLFVIDRATNKTHQLTQRSQTNEQFATAEFVAQEEMKRMTGYWWSPDETHLAVTRIDLSPVAVQRRVDVHADRSELVEQRYPAAGTANVDIDLGLMRLPNFDAEAVQPPEFKWLELQERHQAGYLARVQWLPDSKSISYQWQNRAQNRLTLYRQQLTEKTPQAMIEETSTSWINLNDDLYFLDDSRYFIWASERSGFKHLYLYRTDGSLIRQLTSGDWMVDSLRHVDEITGVVYFTGRKQSPLERHLYRVNLNTTTPSQPSQLSSRAGMHEVVFASDGRSYIDYFSSARQPPQVSLHGPTGQRITWLHENRLDQQHPLSPYLATWSFPEFGHINAADGQRLYYQINKPAQIADNQNHPAVVLVYGGPRAQRVTNSWGDYFTQYLVQQGYVVFKLDNRGSGNRGRQFETGIYRQLSMLEVDDQKLGAQWLAQQPYVNANQIGVFGHSYGGYMALHLIMRAPELFSAAVAGAPVTDWALYDTHYTERYMGTPQDNPEGYQQANVLTYADTLEQPLLIYHGMADDNVLFSHTALLTHRLQQSMLPFEMMAYPGKAHGIRGRTASIHRYTMIAEFFSRHLR